MLKKCLITLTIMIFIICSSYGENTSNLNENFNNLSIDLIDPSMKLYDTVVNFNITESQIEAFNEFTKAIDKFKQNNLEFAYEDFKFIINNIPTNDFGYTLMAGKLADYGLFDLSKSAFGKVTDSAITKEHKNNIENYFFPKIKLPLKEEIYLAEAYSNIMFNEQSKETAEELIKNKDILDNYDYANYITALALYKTNNLPLSRQYIQIAVSQNPKNLNYRILQAQILANGIKPQSALEVIKQLKKEQFENVELRRRVNSIEQYVLYKTSSKEWEKNYHLGYYYFYEGELNKSVKTLQSALGKNNNQNATINSLLSYVYLTMKEYEKAKDSALKTLKVKNKDSKARITLGSIDYLDKNYKKALKNFLTASEDDAMKLKAEVKLAQTYQKLKNEQKVREYYEDVLKKSSSEYEAYYGMSMINPYKELTYLKKALEINIMYTDAWLGLARYEIMRDNFSLAQSYLSTVYYIDKEDFRYYYYQGLIYKSQDDMEAAALYFEKCLKYNPNCSEAKKELKL